MPDAEFGQAFAVPGRLGYLTIFAAVADEMTSVPFITRTGRSLGMDCPGYWTSM
jgi:hypothetical protein